MIKNPFFKNKGPISLKIIFNSCGLELTKKESKTKISDVKSLDLCTNNDISFDEINTQESDLEDVFIQLTNIKK